MGLEIDYTNSNNFFFNLIDYLLLNLMCPFIIKYLSLIYELFRLNLYNCLSSFKFLIKVCSKNLNKYWISKILLVKLNRSQLIKKYKLRLSSIMANQFYLKEHLLLLSASRFQSKTKLFFQYFLHYFTSYKDCFTINFN